MRSPRTVDKGAGPVKLSEVATALPTIRDLNSLQEEHAELRIRYESLRIDFETLLRKHHLLVSRYVHLETSEQDLLKEAINNTTCRRTLMEENESLKQQLAMENNGKECESVHLAVLTIRMSPEMKEQLKSIAFAREESMNHMAVGVLEKFIESQC